MQNNSIGVNISSSFLYRTRCKFCSSGPSLYFAVCKGIYTREPARDKNAWNDPSIFNDWYIASEPRAHTNANNFAFNSDMSFNATMHRTRDSGGHDMINVAVCECGKTEWRFTGKLSSQKPAIVNRRGKYTYSKSIEEYQLLGKFKF
jgi:hypothetical protein